MWRSKQTSNQSGTAVSVLDPPNPSQNISGSEELRIDRAVAEPISLKCCSLTVGQQASVIAEVVAQQVVVYGHLSGNLRAVDRIEIKKDAVVTGDLTTARISIEDGAYFKGNVQIERRKIPRS